MAEAEDLQTVELSERVPAGGDDGAAVQGYGDEDVSEEEEVTEADLHSAATEALHQCEILQGEEVKRFKGRAVVAAMLEASAKTPEQLAEEENEQRGPYYWEDEELTLASPAPLKMWHNMCWAGEKVFEGVELLGEVLVHFFGLNQSRFQWAVEEAAQQRERRRQRALEQRQRQELRARRRMEEARQEQDSMEGGAE